MRFVCEYVFHIRPIPFLIEREYDLAYKKYDAVFKKHRTAIKLECDEVEYLAENEPMLVAWSRQALIGGQPEEVGEIESCLANFGIRFVNNCLDFGCGTGEVVTFFKYDGFIRGRAFGLDPSKVVLSEAEKVSGEAGVEVEWILGRASSMPVETGSLDLVLSLSSLPWCQDIEGTLREVSRVLVKGGVFYCSFPSAKDRLRKLTISLPKAGLFVFVPEEEREDHVTVIGVKT